jgi:hypothetical protein
MQNFYIYLWYLHTKLCMLYPNDLAVITIKLKAKCTFYVTAILLFYILQTQQLLKKSCTQNFRTLH